MIQVHMNKHDYNTVLSLLPNILPEVSFSLIMQDETLVHLGLADSAPCIVAFDMCVDAFYEMLDTLNDIEIDAFDTPDGGDPSPNDPAYQKYLKYGCLYDILYTSEKTFPSIGKVKYIGENFGVKSLTNGKTYDVINIELPFIRIIDDSNEDYLYSVYTPSSLENPTLCGKWEIVNDPKNILNNVINT